MFKGSLVALITPMADDKIDDRAFQDFVAWQIDQGTHALVPCGTTGESPAMTHEEHMHVIELCIEVAKGRVRVMAGTGSNSTSEAVTLTRHAHDVGADAALVVTPYYNKPTQEGLYAHFKAVHDAADIPIIIYNIPGRSVVDMSHETMKRLAKLPNIIGVKDATSDLVRPLRVRIDMGDNFCQLSGEDATVVPFLAHGGVGCISVTANIAPALCAELHNSWQKGDLARVDEINRLLLGVHDAMFCETSPGPVKYAASLLGHCTTAMRLPMVEISQNSKDQVKAALTGAGLLAG